MNSEIIGKRFNTWTVLEYTGNRVFRGKDMPTYKIKCQCGFITRKNETYIKARKGCGKCSKSLSYNSLYNTYRGMVSRCTKNTNSHYYNYGGRGIKIYNEWLDPVSGFQKFKDYIDSNLGPRPSDHALDRIDNNSHYEPGNLRWVTRSENNNNRRVVLGKKSGKKYILIPLEEYEYLKKLHFS